MTTKRRIIVEIVELGWDQREVDYDVQYGSGAQDEAIQSAIHGLHFEPIKGEDQYKGWSRCTINVSGPMCVGEDCLESLDPKNEEDMADQLCPDCRDNEGGE